MPVRFIMNLHCAECDSKIAEYNQHTRRNLIYKTEEVQNAAIDNGVVKCENCGQLIGVMTPRRRIQMRGRGLTLDVEVRTDVQ